VVVGENFALHVSAQPPKSVGAPIDAQLEKQSMHWLYFGSTMVPHVWFEGSVLQFTNCLQMSWGRRNLTSSVQAMGELTRVQVGVLSFKSIGSPQYHFETHSCSLGIGGGGKMLLSFR